MAGHSPNSQRLDHWKMHSWWPAYALSSLSATAQSPSASPIDTAPSNFRSVRSHFSNPLVRCSPPSTLTCGRQFSTAVFSLRLFAQFRHSHLRVHASHSDGESALSSLLFLWFDFSAHWHFNPAPCLENTSSSTTIYSLPLPHSCDSSSETFQMPWRGLQGPRRLSEAFRLSCQQFSWS